MYRRIHSLQMDAGMTIRAACIGTAFELTALPSDSAGLLARHIR